MSDFPSICSTCCGPDKHINMIRQPGGEECKMCTRPFTVFRWNKSRSVNKATKTLLCPTCAQSKNCCQSCMLDIDYHIPLEIRDTALQLAGIKNPYSLQSSSTNREVRAIVADKQQAKFEKGYSDSKAQDILQKLSQRLSVSRVAPVKGNEVKVKSDEASKITKKLPFTSTLTPPEDDSTSFFVFGISEDLPQYVISDFCSQYGTLKSISIVHQAKCGFVTFSSRQSAQAFAAAIASNGLNKDPTKPGLVILDKKYPVRIGWGKPKPLGGARDQLEKIAAVATATMKLLASNRTKVKQVKQVKQGAHKSKAPKKQIPPASAPTDLDIEL